MLFLFFGLLEYVQNIGTLLSKFDTAARTTQSFGCSRAAGCIWSSGLTVHLSQAFGGTGELVDCLSYYTIHFVGAPWSIHIIIALEEMARQITGSVRAARFMKRSACSVDRLSSQTFLDRWHHRVSLETLFEAFVSHHLTRILRVFTSFWSPALPNSSFSH